MKSLLPILVLAYRHAPPHLDVHLRMCVLISTVLIGCQCLPHLQKYPENVSGGRFSKSIVQMCTYLQSTKSPETLWFSSALILEFWEGRWNGTYPDRGQDFNMSLYPHLHMGKWFYSQCCFENFKSPSWVLLWAKQSPNVLGSKHFLCGVCYNRASALSLAMGITLSSDFLCTYCWVPPCFLVICMQALTTSSHVHRLEQAMLSFLHGFRELDNSLRASVRFLSAHSFMLPHAAFRFFLGLDSKPRLSNSLKKENMHKMPFVGKNIFFSH